MKSKALLADQSTEVKEQIRLIGRLREERGDSPTGKRLKRKEKKKKKDMCRSVGSVGNDQRWYFTDASILFQSLFSTATKTATGRREEMRGRGLRCCFYPAVAKKSTHQNNAAPRNKAPRWKWKERNGQTNDHCCW